MDIESITKGLTSVGKYIVGRLGFEQARNMLNTLDEVVALLKKQDEEIKTLTAFAKADGIDVDALLGRKKRNDD